MTLIPFLLVFASLLSLSIANENNVLITGEVLGTDSQLSYLGAVFVMQGDCNLVLYNSGVGFQSDTHGDGVNCTLTLDDHGQLIIKSSDNTVVWTSVPRANTKKGSYAAVVRPDGAVAVYGPTVWSTPKLDSSNADVYGSYKLNIPMVRNLLFSSQILYDNDEIAARDYSFIMRDDCDLVLDKGGKGVVWESGSSGKGKNCFLRLDHKGQLSVNDDHNKILWVSEAAGKDGDYVLIMQINGQAAVYGPLVWST
ncbi:mannose-specific lectin 3-like [Typha latifolia]|uniref:mannose-specific lectin 3-like n=1 Tax=Typha latifolia TaxID=4733 RepID=UPI003C309FB6